MVATGIVQGTHLSEKVIFGVSKAMGEITETVLIEQSFILKRHFKAMLTENIRNINL